MTITDETVRTEIAEIRGIIAEDTARFEMPDDLRQSYVEMLGRLDEIERVLNMPHEDRPSLEEWAAAL